MSMDSRNTRYYSRAGPGPLLLLLCIIMVIVGLPACLLGLLAQRLTSGRMWSEMFWVGLSFVGGGVLWYLYMHGLDRLITKQLSDVLLTLTHEQLNLARWDPQKLWSETWPVWLQTLPAFALIALWREIEEHLRSDSGTRTLVHGEQRRVQRRARSQRRAKRRALHPERLPDEVKGQMVIGVTIDDRDAD